MRPSIALKNKREEVLEIISRYTVANPRVFGSVLHGTDTEGSDLDIWWMFCRALVLEYSSSRQNWQVL